MTAKGEEDMLKIFTRLLESDKLSGGIIEYNSEEIHILIPLDIEVEKALQKC